VYSCHIYFTDSTCSVHLIPHNLTSVVTNSMQYSPSCICNNFPASHEIPLILRNSNVRLRVYKSPPLVPIPNQVNLMSIFRCLHRSKGSVQVQGFVKRFVKMLSFHGEDLSVPRPTHKLEDHPLFAVQDYLFNIFAATLRIWRSSSIHNLRTRHTVVTGTHLS
jgi:hypothetical protein